MHLKEIGWCVLGWIYLVQDRDRCHAIENNIKMHLLREQANEKSPSVTCRDFP